MYKKQKLSIKEKEAIRPKSLRITGLGAPARQLMSEAGRMRLEARKLRRAGNVKGYNELMTRAAMEKIAGEPTVKSQAFVDAQEKAKEGYGTRAQQMQDLMFQFLRDRQSRGYGGLDIVDDGGIGEDDMPTMISNFQVSETGSGLDARVDPNSDRYWRKRRN